MKIFKSLLTLASLAALAAGCKNSDNPIYAPKTPLAGVRFVDAVPDSGAMDWRFVDDIYNTPVTFGLNFRGAFPGSGYSAIGAGSRHLRLFQTGGTNTSPQLSDLSIVTQVLFDTTFTFAANTKYTIVITGTMRDKSAKMFILTDNLPDPGTGVSLRVFNAGVGTVDVYGSATGGSSTLPSAPLVGGLANNTASNYVSVASSATMNLRALASGSTTLPAMIDAAVPAGLAADQPNDLTAVGGISQPGSVLTVFLMPATVTGSTAAKFTTAGALYTVDVNPASGF